jgi:L-iditol 2-dehydrogenase
VKAALLHAPGDLRIEEVPRPQPAPGDVLVQIEVALTDGTDLKTFRRGHPLLARESPAPFGHEFCGIVDGRSEAAHSRLSRCSATC